VADEARRLIDILGADGGYIFGPGHTYIQVDAPVDNILAMYQTGRTHRLPTRRRPNENNVGPVAPTDE